MPPPCLPTAKKCQISSATSNNCFAQCQAIAGCSENSPYITQCVCCSMGDLDIGVDVPECSTAVGGGTSVGGSCSSDTQCTSGSCKGGRCCGSSGTSPGCTACNSVGGCASCGSDYTLSTSESRCFFKGTCAASEYWPQATNQGDGSMVLFGVIARYNFNEEVNGVYNKLDTFNDRPSYKKLSYSKTSYSGPDEVVPEYFLYYMSDQGAWYISTTLGGTSINAQLRQNVLTPDQATIAWEAWDGQQWSKMDGCPSKLGFTLGDQCYVDFQCASGSCRGGKCCNLNGQSAGCMKCDFDGDCLRCDKDYCYKQFACVPAKDCEFEDGAFCTVDIECASGLCQGNRCQKKPTTTAPTTTSTTTTTTTATTTTTETKTSFPTTRTCDDAGVFDAASCTQSCIGLSNNDGFSCGTATTKEAGSFQTTNAETTCTCILCNAVLCKPPPATTAGTPPSGPDPASDGSSSGSGSQRGTGGGTASAGAIAGAVVGALVVVGLVVGGAVCVVSRRNTRTKAHAITQMDEL